MKALIFKDIVTIKKSIILTLFLSIAIGVYGIYNNAILVIPGICLIIPIILTSISFGYDTKSNFEQFAFSMPIGRDEYVYSKLFFAFVFSVFGASSIFLYLYIQNNFPMTKIILFSIITLLIILLFSSLQLPIILKYGTEKGRLVMVFTYFIIFGSTSFLKEYKEEILITINKFSSRTISIFIILIGALIIIISISMAINVMKNKEF